MFFSRFRASIKRGVDASLGMFKTNPYSMNAAVGLVVSVSGDLLAQKSEFVMAGKKNAQFDLKRTAAIGVFGTVVYGGVITNWYRMLEKVIGKCNGVGPALFKKILADEIILGPVFNGSYLSYHAFLANESVPQSLQQNFVPTMLADFAIWPPAMFIGFLRVSTAARPAYVAAVGVCWNAILSYMGRRELEVEVEVIEEKVAVLEKTVIAKKGFLEEAIIPMQIIPLPFAPASCEATGGPSDTSV